MNARRATTPRAHRALRGCLLALSSAALAIAAHGMAGGGVSDAGLTVPLAALLAWGGIAVADRRHELVTLLAVLGVTQASLHLLLTEVAYQHTGHTATVPASGAAMLATHTIATVITGVLLIKASSAIARVSSAVAWLLGQLLVPRSAPVFSPAAIGPDSTVPVRPGVLLEVLLRRTCARRGPPLFS